MNIYIKSLSTLTKKSTLLDQYVNLCLSFQNFNSKKDAEEQLKMKVEIHHILPKCFNLGGNKDKSNLTYLPLLEHRNAHKLLKEMFEGLYKQKMCFAYSRLVHRHGSINELSDAEYVSLKQDISLYVGKLNSERIITDDYRKNMSKVKKDTIWINNGLYEKMINKIDVIPDGFVNGRLSNQNKNRIWVNNGITNKMIIPSECLPEGWSLGMFKTNKKGT